MSKLSDFFNTKSEPIQEIESGFYTSHDLMHGETPYRLHLRVEPNLRGVLTLNASTILHLNKTAMEMAYFLIQGQKPAEIAKTISNRYKAPKDEIKRDVDTFYDTLMSFTTEEDIPPSSILGTLSDPEETEIIAPYRLDCYFGDEAKGERLTVAEWKVVFERAFNAGIPHVMLLDSNHLPNEDFLDLLSHLEDLGLVSGLVTKPDYLMDSAFLHELLVRGLDHLVLDGDPSNFEHHRLLINILDQDLFTCLRMPFDPRYNYKPVMDDLFSHGINAFAFTGVVDPLDDSLLELEELISSQGIPIVDDMPFSHKDHRSTSALAYESASKLKYLATRADGELFIPYEDPVDIGNLLNESWEELWAKCRQFSNG